MHRIFFLTLISTAMVKFSTVSLALIGAAGQLSAVYAAPVASGPLATIQQTFMQAQINMTSISGAQKW
jgi:hypothetical protein